MTLATAITLLRLLLVPLFLLFLFSHTLTGRLLAAAVFAFAAATDGLDGYFARSRNEVTRLGIFLDPLADKCLIGTALLALAFLDRIPWWLAAVILGREVAVTALRIALAARGRSLAATPWGKVKTISQIIAVVAILLELPAGLPLLFFSAFLTVTSGAYYFLHL